MIGVRVTRREEFLPHAIHVSLLGDPPGIVEIASGGILTGWDGVHQRGGWGGEMHSSKGSGFRSRSSIWVWYKSDSKLNDEIKFSILIHSE